MTSADSWFIVVIVMVRDMIRVLAFICAALVASALLAGCGGGTATVNSERIGAIEQDTDQLKESVEAVRVSLEQLAASIKALEQSAEEIKYWAEMPDRIEEGTERVAGMLESIERKLDALERQDPAAVRMKVLSGDGRLESARRVAAVLRERGYDVDAVGMAPSKGFEADTVFYADGFEAAAARVAGNLAESLGRGARTRPLTWSSVYEIIVVTGGK